MGALLALFDRQQLAEDFPPLEEEEAVALPVAADSEQALLVAAASVPFPPTSQPGHPRSEHRRRPVKDLERSHRVEERARRRYLRAMHSLRSPIALRGHQQHRAQDSELLAAAAARQPSELEGVARLPLVRNQPRPSAPSEGRHQLSAREVDSARLRCHQQDPLLAQEAALGQVLRLWPRQALRLARAVDSDLRQHQRALRSDRVVGSNSQRLRSEAPAIELHLPVDH